ncbi:hypothetical protein [Caldanaerobius fijiensis]|uniref:hypothetical protein n=1 Tax=Caldanaerobius fijiensis TaxID=456330 RepID=UPI001356612E|nr:hypothetical protein [Caldanaerobius fijiensis]
MSTIDRILNIFIGTVTWLIELPFLVGQLLFWLTMALITGTIMCISWCVIAGIRFLRPIWFLFVIFLIAVGMLHKVSIFRSVVVFFKQNSAWITHDMISWSHSAATYLVQHPLLEIYVILVMSYAVFIAFSAIFGMRGKESDMEEDLHKRQAPYQVWLPKEKEKEKK